MFTDIFNKKYTIAIVLVITIALHFFMLVFYFDKYDPIGKQPLENSSIISYINLLQALLNADSKEPFSNDISRLMNLRLELDNHAIKTSFSFTPKNSIRFSGNLAKINLQSYLSSMDSDEIEFSYQLKNSYWFNVNADIPYFFYINLLLLFIIDLIIAWLFVSFIWTTWRFAVPLEEFKKSAEQIGIDLNATPLNIKSGPHVVKETAYAINRMRTRINNLIDNRTMLLAGLSHDLRTPITKLKLLVQFIPKSEYTEKITNTLNDVEQMMASILDFAKIDSLHEKKIKLDITALLHTICEDYVDLGYPVQFNAESDRINIYGRLTSLKRAFSNLIQNAIKYGEKAKVLLIRKGSAVNIIIEDQGPGIPDNEIENVFKSFYRVKDNSNTAGYGLGMTIAYEVISGHEGTIAFENMQPQGLRITVNIPIIT